MATKLANSMGPNGMHTAGIFADMTVDGPEIGTLVLVVDRAKNLPNRKTMGKQNPYCAARLGKEAKKTETDKRGGQTPKWDQEIRFTVHDSPDYYNLKISVFSEDKRTDLIGESWVSLTDVVVPGGGKADLWQNLNCKGKYAGELRLELTYYDIRPKPEKSAMEGAVAEEEGLRSTSSGGKVKRRPLPANPNNPGVADSIPDLATPGRAKHGPREYRMPSRANSMPVEPSTLSSPQAPVPIQQPIPLHAPPHAAPYPRPHEHTPQDQYYPEPEQYGQSFDDSYLHPDFTQPPPQQNEYLPHQQPAFYPQEDFASIQHQPDFLPQLPPSGRQRGSTTSRFPGRPAGHSPLPHDRPLPHAGIAHSHSAPMVPLAQDAHSNDYQLRTDFPEPIPDVDYQHRQLRQRRNDVPPGWQEEYGNPQEKVHREEDVPPPPPPMHSNSAPTVPHFSSPSHSHLGSSPASARYPTTPPSARHNSVPANTSPYPTQQSQRTPTRSYPVRGGSVDSYGTPPSLTPGQTPSPSPYTRNIASRVAAPHRHSVADPYNATPPRPHPLSQEVPRARSPRPPTQPYAEMAGVSPQSQPYERYDSQPTMSRRSVSPLPPLSLPNQNGGGVRPRSSYNLQHPVRAFESSDQSPLSSSQSPYTRVGAGSNPQHLQRKSVSPRPSPVESPSPSIPFSPDSFDVHNPNARPSPLAGNSPHAPYHIRESPTHSGSPREAGAGADKGPIVGWHGQEIDPSDHLPVDSWAPEPLKKNTTPTKTYGAGRDRDFGPRSAAVVMSGSGGRVSKDTVINVRSKATDGGDAASRNRLVKKNGNHHQRSHTGPPLGGGGFFGGEDRQYGNGLHGEGASIPDPYAQQQEYSHGFHEVHGGSGYPPSIPPKVPLQQYQQEYGNGHGNGHGQGYGYNPTDALTREISTIDIGTSSGGRRGGRGVAFVPVRSQRDRETYY